jgi:hypothetical protein
MVEVGAEPVKEVDAAFALIANDAQVGESGVTTVGARDDIAIVGDRDDTAVAVGPNDGRIDLVGVLGAHTIKEEPVRYKLASPLLDQYR